MRVVQSSKCNDAIKEYDMKRRLPLLIFLPLAIGLRFYIQDPFFSFLWFVILYFPMLNWSTYWLFCFVRLSLNRVAGREIWTTEKTRQAFIVYLYIPGSLAFAELVYLGYEYHYLSAFR
jgi:hypothetical protein